jgi:F-type H+-transporting ATPase subunit b
MLIADAGLGGLFTALGLNLQTFILDLIAFLITAWVVGKYVFPPLTKALDAKREELEAATRHEKESQDALAKAERSAAELLTKARESADGIIATAHADAAEQLDAARVKAKEQSERLIAEAREQLARDVVQARRELKGETAKLAVAAAEAVLDEKLDRQHDEKLIARSLEAK